MITYMPVPSATITFASKWVDEALGFAMGWNYFLNIILNVVSVTWFGTAEFYIGMFKILLALGLTFYTFITMVGGYPKHDVYGFRFGNEPGPFAENLVTGPSGRLCGVVAAATFIVRVLLFFVGGAFCIGIVIPYDDPTLAKLLGQGVSTGAASPVVNAGIMLSLVRRHGMAMDGKAPRVFARCTGNGIRIWALLASLSLCLLVLLQVSESSAKVMDYLVVLITANQLLNHFSVSLTYIHFYRALQAQGISRNTLPYKGKFQPYTSYIAVGGTAILTLFLGFDMFVDMPNDWDITYFFLDYAMLVFYAVLFVAWKVGKRTRWLQAGQVDLGLGGAREEIEAYEKMQELANMAMAFLIPVFVLLVLSVLSITTRINTALIRSPLSSIRGPKLFALTKWRLALEDYRGTRTTSVRALHSRYGALVRIGPNEVSFNSLSALRTIYGAGTVFQPKTEQFMDLVERDADAAGNLEIFHPLHYFSLDSITAFLYGKNRGQNGATSALAPFSPHRRLSWFTIHFPSLTSWIYTRTGLLESLLTFFNLLPMRKPSTYTGIRAHALKAAQEINQFVTETGTINPNESITERILHAMQANREKRQCTLDILDVASECADHLLAGIDTTSDTIMWAIFLLSQPENKIYQERLRAEIHTGSSVPSPQIKLPFLDAVIKETLRLFAPLPGTEPRIADTDQVIDGYLIPAGTVVSISPYTMHRNPNVFRDPERFGPVRWLTAEKEELAEMNRWFWAFSSGGRMCIGMQ
ncbi:cytochrome P450 [Aspergillus desertorum]